MLKNVETNIQKTNPVLMVQKGEGMKRKGKGKGNKAKKGKGQSKTKAKKPKLPKEGVCFFCMNKVIGKGIISSTWKI